MLEDPTTLDIVVNPDGRMWVNWLGGGFEYSGQFPSKQVKLLLSGIATVRHLRLDHEHPILETIFPLSGDRIEGLIPPVVSEAVCAIRTRPKKIYTLDDLSEAGVLTRREDPLNAKRHHDDFVERSQRMDHVEVIRLAARYRRNTLLVGATGSGKTSLGNGIIAAWAEATPSDRIVIIEDTPELQCALPNHVQLLATAHVSQADLLVASLRLIPKRIVVGEVREPEAARVLLGAWNTGHSGGLATIHANDSLSGLRKLEVLVGGDLLSTRQRIAEAVDLVIYIDSEESLAAGRKVREMLFVQGFDSGSQDYRIEYL